MFALIEKARAAGASDIHLTVDCRPLMRCCGELLTLDEHLVTDEEMAEFTASTLTHDQEEYLNTMGEIDFSCYMPDKSRCRINFFRQCGHLAAAIRLIADQIPDCAEIGLPDSVCRLVYCTHGLVLITGATGSGKSTTLSALINKLNNEKSLHILTLEDPVEYRHQHAKSIINQREIGTDTKSFAAGLRSALREDPDVIMVGELRDRETVATALKAAETGHLVLATLHTNNAVSTISRIIDFFPENQQQVRSQLAECLQGIVCQELLMNAAGNGRVAAFEVMTLTPALRNLIREGKMHQIESFIQTGMQHGMITKADYIKKLVREGKIKLQ